MATMRLKCKNLFLTYPQCSMPKEVALQNIINLYETEDTPELLFAVVSQEAHTTETGIHLHCAISTSRVHYYGNGSILDDIADKHGNYQPARSLRRVVNYVVKHGDYCSHGIEVDRYLSAAQSKQSTKSALIVRAIQQGSTLEKIVDDYPGYCLLHLRHVQAFQSWWREVQARKSILRWRPFKTDYITEPADYSIACWCNTNLRQLRAFKQEQLYIWGACDLGKTHFVLELAKRMKVYFMPVDESFYDHYSDDVDLVVIDEFKGQKKVSFMNLFLQGSRMEIRVKGAQYHKVKNVPVIILSNHTLEVCYSNVDQYRLDTLRSRLKIIHVLKQINLF